MDDGESVTTDAVVVGFNDSQGNGAGECGINRVTTTL